MISNTTEIDAAVATALAPFDEARPVEPYRVYVDHNELALMARYYQIHPANLTELATRMPAWRNETGGVDRQGLYHITTNNPDGRWDWYEIGGRWNCQIHTLGNVVPSRRLVRSKKLENCLPQYVLTPDGIWLECERIYMGGDWRVHRHDKFSDDEWLSIVQATLRQWPDHLVVCVDMHC